jgi:hypothetical protein
MAGVEREDPRRSLVSLSTRNRPLSIRRSVRRTEQQRERGNCAGAGPRVPRGDGGRNSEGTGMRLLSPAVARSTGPALRPLESGAQPAWAASDDRMRVSATAQPCRLAGPHAVRRRQAPPAARRAARPDKTSTTAASGWTGLDQHLAIPPSHCGVSTLSAVSSCPTPPAHMMIAVLELSDPVGLRTKIHLRNRTLTPAFLRRRTLFLPRVMNHD